MNKKQVAAALTANGNTDTSNVIVETVSGVVAETENKETPETIHVSGELPDNVVEAWKRKYGDVNVVTVTAEDGTHLVGYYKKPDRNIIANCVNDASAGKIFEAREFLAQNTWLGGDKRQQTDDDVAIPVQIELWRSLNFLKAVAKKY